MRIAITRLGSPSLRPTATAVTASGGATIAPSTNAVPNVSGTHPSQLDTAATVNAVTTTSPTPRPRIGRMLRRNVGNEKSSAAEYSSGGSTTVSRMCESSSGASKPGTNDTATADDHDDQRGFEPAPVGDGGDDDGPDDDQDQFHPTDCPVKRGRPAGLNRRPSTWQVGHQNRLRPSITSVRIGVPQTRHGSPARR